LDSGLSQPGEGSPIGGLLPLCSGHAPAVLAFERANRDYFAASISDRGDEYFDQFAERHQALLAEQEDGLRRLKAKVALENIASQKVLTKAGFVPAGPADIGGRAGIWYQRAL
jgi:hypothetical protein